jgi:RNA-dependent RNA polymerase
VWISLQSYTVQTVPDVVHNRYCFSDGVGRISVDLAQAVAQRLIALGRCPAGWLPRAFQIRYAGCKGMVSLHPPLQGMRCASLKSQGLGMLGGKGMRGNFQG